MKETSTLKRRIGLFAALAALFAQENGTGGGKTYPYLMPDYGGMMPLVKERRGDVEAYGLYRASSKTHKRYLRKNHLGKFKKGK